MQLRKTGILQVSHILNVVALIAEFNETTIDTVIWGESSLEWDCQAMENKNLSFLKGPSFVGRGCMGGGGWEGCS